MLRYKMLKKSDIRQKAIERVYEVRCTMECAELCCRNDGAEIVSAINFEVDENGRETYLYTVKYPASKSPSRKWLSFYRVGVPVLKGEWK